MKKAFSLFLALALCLSLGGVGNAKNDAVSVGDILCDGAVGAEDLTAMARAIGGIESLPARRVLVAGQKEYGFTDLNLDGNVTADDLTVLACSLGNIRSPEAWKDVRVCVPLEFTLLQNMAGVDMTGFDELSGLIGGREYLGSAYRAVVGEGNFRTAPDAPYVIYTLTAWPDYADGGQYVTHIEITDPDVTVFGLTPEDDFDTFDRVMTANGYEITQKLETSHLARKDGIYVILNRNALILGAEVTNREDIVF